MEYLLVTIFAAVVSVALLTSAGLFLEAQMTELAERWQLDLSLSLSDLLPGS